MEQIKKILAPVDLSNLSKLGLRHALDIAQSQGAEVIVYNVISVEETPFPQGDEAWVASQTELPKIKKTLEERRKLLESFVADSLGGQVIAGQIRQVVEIGTPYRKIITKATEEGADMIVMSTHGRTGLLHMLIGSVTEKVVRRAPCPVLAVPPPKTKRGGN